MQLAHDFAFDTVQLRLNAFDATCRSFEQNVLPRRNAALALDEDRAYILNERMTKINGGTGGEPGRGQATRDRILDAAEQLFARQGMDGTSLREITSAAGVNLAAVNYHFQSKEALIRAVFARRIGPLNEHRLALLNEAERAAAPAAPTPEAIFDALAVPVLELSASVPSFGPVLGRLYTEPGTIIEAVIHDHMSPVAARFIPALQRALPHLAPVDLMWRIAFTVGAISHVLAAANLIRAISGGSCEPADLNEVRRQLLPFIIAGFEAPAPRQTRRFGPAYHETR